MVINIGLIAAELFLLVVLLAAAWYLRKLRRQLAQQKLDFKREVSILEDQNVRLEDAGLHLLQLKEALELEQEKSARLLRNILPERVINDLREKGESLPERFDNVTVLFADIVNFTEIAAQLDPTELIKELNDIFSEFDRIFSKHNCVRIKTVGDAYMAAGGLPESDIRHCEHILQAACEARQYLHERNLNSHSRYQWQMRFGVNSGSVVGGIVGREKYIYDILGDTVNTASRIEHASEAMQINVSQSTRDLAAGAFEFAARGAVEVKGKGPLEMYFLIGEKRP